MQIVGGNMRWLFGEGTLQGLRAFLLVGLNSLRISDFSAGFGGYFTAAKYRNDTPDDRLFACYPPFPFTDEDSLSYLSVWVQSRMNSIIFSVKDKRKAAKILVMRNWLSRIVGLHFVTKSVHGFLFEDLCHALIT
jgi:hypothetical protein